MIIKKVEKKVQRGGAVGIARGIRNLVAYISKDEKVLLLEGRGFLCDSPAAWKEEMVATATGHCDRQVSNSVDHWVFSWKSNEFPTKEQLEEAIDVFLKELGIPEDQRHDYQLIYALHGDARHVHMHVLLNRRHPMTQKVHHVKFYREAAQRAVALIEHLQGWQPEPRARYVVEADEQGNLQVRRRAASEERQEPNSRAATFERITGAKSSHRELLEDKALSDAIRNAKSWPELHESLHKLNAWMGKKGAGAVLFYKGSFWKASDLGRFASLKSLEKKLGYFQPSPYASPAVSNNGETKQPTPLKTVATREWQEYYAERKESKGKSFPDFYRWLREKKNALLAEQWLHTKYGESPPRLSMAPTLLRSSPPRGLPLEAVYAVHLAHMKYLAGEKRKADYSTIDAEIAMRMRANGHSADEIKEAIKAYSKKAKQFIAAGDSKGLQNYTERLAKFAFSTEAELFFRRHPQTVESWKKLELAVAKKVPQQSPSKRTDKQRDFER